MRNEDECKCASEISGRSDSDLLNVLNIIREGSNGTITISLQENSRHREWESLGLPSHICAWKIVKMKRVIRICHPVTFQARTENLSTSTAHYTTFLRLSIAMKLSTILPTTTRKISQFAVNLEYLQIRKILIPKAI